MLATSGPPVVRWENHQIASERPLECSDLDEMGEAGWECFSVVGPAASDPSWRYFFRRPARGSRGLGRRTPTASAPLKGGVDRDVHSFGDLLGRFADGAPVRLRRR